MFHTVFGLRTWASNGDVIPLYSPNDALNFAQRGKRLVDCGNIMGSDHMRTLPKSAEFGVQRTGIAILDLAAKEGFP